MIKRLKRRFIIVNMTIVTTIVTCLFIIVCIITSSSQKEQTLKYLELSIMREERTDVSLYQAPPPQAPGVTDDKFDMPHIYTFIAYIDRNGKIINSKDNGENINQNFIEAVVNEAIQSNEPFGEVNNGELMYLIKETRIGAIISFTSTEPVRDNVNNTIVLFLFLCLGSIVIFFFISERLAHYAVMPVKKAWENHKQFVADASHDLKTPLTVILANNDILNSHSNESVESQRKWIDSTEEEALKMKGLVSQMLELAKSENAICLSLSRVNLSEITEREILLLEPIVFEKQISICSSIDQGVITITNEESYLRIVQTLLDNAIKYSNQGEKIRVYLASDKQRIYLRVNNSSYIDEKKQAHIFERFWREDSSRGNDGHGLGLAIAKNLAISLNGDLNVKSDAKDGTTFILTLKKK